VANGFTMPNYRSMGFLVLLFHADILLVSYPPYAWVLEFLKLLPFTRKIMGCKVPSNRITKVVRGFYVPGGGGGGVKVLGFQFSNIGIWTECNKTTRRLQTLIGWCV